MTNETSSHPSPPVDRPSSGAIEANSSNNGKHLVSPSQSVVEKLKSAHAEAQAQFGAADRVVDGLGNIRLIFVFLAIALVLMPLYARSGTPWWGLVPLSIAFIILGKIQDRWQERRRVAWAGVQYLEGSLARSENTWRTLPDTGEEVGEPWRGTLHYADDLDLFGKASAFQLLSRAVTAQGRRTLAKWLCEPAGLQEIQARQEACQVMSNDLALRIRCFSAAATEETQDLPDKALLAWAEQKEGMAYTQFLYVIGLLLPIVLLSTATWAFIFEQSREPFYLAALVQIGALLWTRGLTAERAAVLAGPERILNRYARLIEVVEALPSGSARLDQLKAVLTKNEVSASQEIKRLEYLVEWLNARLNMFFALTLGPALMWELNIVLRAEQWRLKVGQDLRQWIEVLGEVEALASLGAFAHERPDYSYPEFQENGLVFEAEGLAHILIDRDSVVSNDISLGQGGAVTLLSGSNMSGKSTLLRAIGLSIVLASMGAPVAARRLRLLPLRLATSVRVVDSLAAGASHFYAELRRLKHVTDLAAKDGPTLIYLLDEVLHGTNSRERFLGAVSVVKWLSEAGAVGVVTTHDLELARVSEVLPEGLVVNAHFSDDVSGDGLQFDYKLRTGPIQTTNALRMMRAVGIDVEFIEFPQAPEQV